MKRLAILHIILIFPFIVYSGGILTSEIPSKEKPMQRIEITSIDSLGNLETQMNYPDEFLEDIFASKMDSLMNSWYVRNAYDIDSRVSNDTIFENFINFEDIEGNLNVGRSLPDSIYIQRLSAIHSPIDLSFNTTVKNVITLYTERRRDQVEVMLGLANYYFPMFEEILDKYEMPIELKYMAIIESALNARALSRAGACGLWQFMYGTGKMYGLEINSYVDERRDPLKSTEAAARYLNDLYNIYNDWHMVIAAYNCGPGNVNKAIRRSGGRDYWSIYYRLPRETRGYVPAFIAATYVMNYYKLHNLTPRQTTFNIITDTIMVNNYLHFDQITASLGLDIEQLRDINPMYRRDVIPATNDKPYPLRLPIGTINRFVDHESDIYAYNREVYFPNNQIKNPDQKTAQQFVPVDEKGKARIHYTVKSGDNVGFIAEWFKVRIADLRYWNNIRGNLIRVGQRLVIYVPENKADHFKAFNAMSFEEKQRAAGKNPTNAPVSIAATSSNNNSIDPSYEYYTVRQGDNLWVISQKYPGITATDIQNLNNIKNTRSLYAGQQLKIKKK